MPQLGLHSNENNREKSSGLLSQIKATLLLFHFITLCPSPIRFVCMCVFCFRVISKKLRSTLNMPLKRALRSAERPNFRTIFPNPQPKPSPLSMQVTLMVRSRNHCVAWFLILRKAELGKVLFQRSWICTLLFSDLAFSMSQTFYYLIIIIIVLF